MASHIAGAPTPLPANRSAGQTARRLGELHRRAGALTHDVNNLLGVIVSANERLADELEDGSEPQRLARLALEAAEQAADLLRRALEATHPDRRGPEPLDGAACLDAVRRLAGQAVPAGVRLSVRGPGHALPCLGERTGLEMALLNLILNAGQATPDGGRIRVQARQALVGRSDGRRLGLAPGAYVAFSVRDTGKGMSPQILARAADPLFTTRAAGTGLGLSSVVDFAAAAGGALALQSRAGRGCTATLYVPAAPGGVAVAAA